MKRILRKMQTLVLAVAGKEVLVRPDVTCRTERFGSEYGGWNLATAGIERDSVVYSFGVGEDASFDMDLIERFDLKVHAFDPTPRSIEWVRRQDLPGGFVLHEVGLAAHDGTVSFNPPQNPVHVSHTVLDRPSTRDKAITVPVKRLGSIMSELGHDRIDVLKMDIEGAEYEVLEDLGHSGIRPRQILVEFHHRFPGVGVARTRKAIAALRSMGYALFHVSDRNEEFGFVLESG
jgi:FkbM family methyltransferase